MSEAMQKATAIEAWAQQAQAMLSEVGAVWERRNQLLARRAMALRLENQKGASALSSEITVATKQYERLLASLLDFTRTGSIEAAKARVLDGVIGVQTISEALSTFRSMAVSVSVLIATGTAPEVATKEDQLTAPAAREHVKASEQRFNIIVDTIYKELGDGTVEAALK